MKKQIALTFDDGPGPDTDLLLTVLKRHEQQATFFVTGERAVKQRDMLDRIRTEGHQLAYHGWNHERARTFDEVNDQLDRLENSWLKLKLNRPYYRPPYGIIDPGGRMACSLRGWAVVLWHLAPYDWTPRHPEMIADDLTKNVRSRSIILLHDHHEGGEVYEHTDRAGSVDALDLFLRRVKPFLKSVTLKELLEGEYRNEKLP